MNRWEKLQDTLKQPETRTKLAFFLVLSFSTGLLSVWLQLRSAFWGEVFKDFAVTLGAVGLLQLLWDFLGGQPLELEFEKIQRSVTVLADLADGNIGIERIWLDRRSWQEDRKDGRMVWWDRVCQARRIDVLSNTFWNNWMKEPDFAKRLFIHIAQGAQVRILVYDPYSDVLKLRAQAEVDPFVVVQQDGVHGLRVHEMQIEINSTLVEISTRRCGLSPAAKKNLEVRLTNRALHPAQIIRADSRMLVALYLSGKSGSPSPTIQIRGADSSYYCKYYEQFRIHRNWARPITDDQFAQILECGHLPTP